MTFRYLVCLGAVLAVSCSLPESEPLPPGTFSFAVFGDGPYRAWEMGRYRHVIHDVNRADVAWLVHVGDIFSYPCSDKSYADRLASLNSIRVPVVYTPGDNEWVDCHQIITGKYSPLERLEHLRGTFFADPLWSLGGRRMSLESQSENPAYSEFVENARWVHGGFLFATIHLVASENAPEPFLGWGAAEDQEVSRRTAAAEAWLTETFAAAGARSSKGVVLSMHTDPGLDRNPDVEGSYGEFVDRLEDLVREFPGPVLLIHGDSHTQRFDHPLRNRRTGRTVRNFARLETFGSPDIGWVRVVVDTTTGRMAFEPRRMPGWWL